MKAVITGIVLASIFALGFAFVLDNRVHDTVEHSFSTTGVRL